MGNHALTLHGLKTSSPSHASGLIHSSIQQIFGNICFMPGSVLGAGDTVENVMDVVSVLSKISALEGELHEINERQHTCVCACTLT